MFQAKHTLSGGMIWNQTYQGSYNKLLKTTVILVLKVKMM